MFIQISDNLKKLAKSFPENLYIVGGYVRNKLLGIDNSDVDLASSVSADEVVNRLKDSGYLVKIKNIKLGSLLICKDKESFEYTAFRKETYDQTGTHCPSIVESTSKIEEDAIRRDFSVNTIYYNINKDEIVDLYKGIIDLSEKTIRTNIEPEKVFNNDGERILRMIRIAGELNFKIEPKTLKGATKFSKNLSDIQGNRKMNEIEKILYCDRRYNLNKKSLRKSLNLLNIVGVWEYFGLKSKTIKYNMTCKVEDRFLGLLIDIVDTEKPECLETFLFDILKNQFGQNQKSAEKIFIYLSGYYNALRGMKNKEFFYCYFENWAGIFSLLGKKSKRVQSRYSFFYQYIIEHGLLIKVSDLLIDENDIKVNFQNIDKRNYNRILSNLWSKVFDGKLLNTKESLLKEIEENLQNF